MMYDVSIQLDFNHLNYHNQILVVRLKSMDVFAGFSDTTTSHQYKEGAEQLQSQSVDVESFMEWSSEVNIKKVCLERGGDKMCLLHIAVMFRAPLPCIKVVLAANLDAATLKDEDGRTALHYALMDACTAVALIIIAQCPSSAYIIGPSNQTPLFISILNTDLGTEVVLALLNTWYVAYT